MSDIKIINIGKDFSRFPVGRYLTDGESNGQKFREEMLDGPLRQGQKLEIQFDDALGYGSSFLEEAFGGLIRINFELGFLMTHLVLKTDDDSLKEEVLSYIREAHAAKKK